MANKKIGIIGLGNMGNALLNGILAKKVFSRANVYGFDTDAKKASRVKQVYKINLCASNVELVRMSDIIILAIKPQDIALLIDEIRHCLDNSKLIISILAGVKTKSIEQLSGRRLKVVRVMPNTPALVGKAVSSISKGRYAAKSDALIADKIFRAVGETVNVKEDLKDAVTAISGSGPAYVFYFIEALHEAAKKLGLKDKLSKKLIRSTIYGSLALLDRSGLAPSRLRANVTSKKGTTEAALKVFEKKQFKKIVAQALLAARNRSRQLSRSI